MTDLAGLQEHILQLLADSDDSTSVTNRALRVLLARRLNRDVTSDEYFAAIDDLTNRGLIGRKRGQGGQVSLIRQPPTSRTGYVTTQPSTYWDEPRLMACLEKYLNTTMWRELDLPRGNGGEWLVINTSMSGPRKGKWARPDFTVVSVMPFQILPTPLLDLYSFELKTEMACNLTSVHEALGQTRMTNYGYLVWHLPPGSTREIDRADIAEHCAKHGIGLTIIRDPTDPNSWEILHFASRMNTPLTQIDAYLASTRLTEDQQQSLRRKLSGG